MKKLKKKMYTIPIRKRTNASTLLLEKVEATKKEPVLSYMRKLSEGQVKLSDV